MTDSHPTDETIRSTEAEPSGDQRLEDGNVDSEDDASDPSATGSLSRRGALAVLTALGLGSVATGNASAASGDHLGELWDGSPGTGRGLETVLREKGQALKGTAGTNTDDTNDIGVKGTTYSNKGIGLEGLAAASSGNTIGLKGRTDSPDGTALFGEARNSSSGSSLAVEGLSRAADGTAIQGHAGGTGDTIGVEGRVDSPNGYGLSTPDDARIEGTVDTNGTDFIVETSPTSADDARNVVHGHATNGVQDSAVAATVGGGGGENLPNLVTDDYGTVGGGENNTAGDTDGDGTSAPYATVGGGRNNDASGEDAFVGGGTANTASALRSTVGGGITNTASRARATVGGGTDNAASGRQATVSGGESNAAGDKWATVGGGYANDARAQFATVSGGGPSDPSSPSTTNNVAYNEYATVGGGANNRAGSQDGDTTTGKYATVAGGEDNVASDLSTTVSGGERNRATQQTATVGGGLENEATSIDATVSGGLLNEASGGSAAVGGGGSNIASGGSATVAGGSSNTADGLVATVAGGEQNTASGYNAAVPGGFGNQALKDYSFAAGAYAKANANGSFVWGDSSLLTPESTTEDEVVFQADGGVTLWSSSDFSSGVRLNAGAGSWSSLSARAAKSNVTPVDPDQVLEAVTDLEISRWEYDSQTDVTHMGPMAGAFHDAFELGADEERITNVDADGVALAAVQGLAERDVETVDRVDELEAEIDGLREANETLREETDVLRGDLAEKEDRIDELVTENETLRERLAAVEEHLDLEASQSNPATDDD